MPIAPECHATPSAAAQTLLEILPVFNSSHMYMAYLMKVIALTFKEN